MKIAILHPLILSRNHYNINIDSVELGIGWTYNPDAKTWSAPIVPVKEGKS